MESRSVMYHHQKLASIADLPTELLNIVFQLVYKHSRDYPLWMFALDEMPDDLDKNEPEGTKWRAEDLRTPSLFPYALASVCTRWARVLSMNPAYWTRLVAFVDDNFAPNEIASQLAWSGDLPFDLTLTRHSDSLEILNLEESKRVHAVIAALRPHIHRCVTLRIDVSRSSSLPLLCRDFSGVASRLEELQMKCAVDDGSAKISLPSGAPPFSSPMLKKVIIDALNFMTIGANLPSWKSCLQDLTVINFAASSRGGVGFPMYIFLGAIRQLPKLEYLSVGDVDFMPLNGLRPPRTLKLSSLNISGLSKDASSDLLSAVRHMESLSISNCSLPSTVENSLPSSYFLTLDTIHDISDPREFAVTFIARIAPCELSLTNCPGVANEVCKIMGENPVDRPTALHLPELRSLSIVDSPEISLEILKNSIIQRQQWYHQHGQSIAFDHYDIWRISSIGVVRSCSNVPSHLAQWFRSHMDWFKWTA